MTSTLKVRNIEMGEGAASDSKILFDGNAQDFHIGLDDSSDSLTIGLGSALGTTSHMVMDANGHITKPLQSAFLAVPASDQTSIAVASEETVVFGTEVFDQNGDFASNTFTAPVTGRYQLNVAVRLTDVDSASNYYYIRIVTSNRTFYQIFDPDFGQDADFWTLTIAVLADMDASDTAHVIFAQQGGTQQTDVHTASSFSGYLVC